MSWKISAYEIAKAFCPKPTVVDVVDVLSDENENALAYKDGTDDLEKSSEDENNPSTMPSKNDTNKKMQNDKKNLKTKPPRPSPYKRKINEEQNNPRTNQQSSVPPTFELALEVAPTQRGPCKHKQFSKAPPAGSQNKRYTSVPPTWVNVDPTSDQAQARWMPIAQNRYSAPPPPIIHHNQEQIMMQMLYAVSPPTLLGQRPPTESVMNLSAVPVVPPQTEPMMHSLYAQSQHRNIEEYNPSVKTSSSLGNQSVNGIDFDLDYHPRPAKLISVIDTQWQHSQHWLVDLFGVQCFGNMDGECNAPNCKHTTRDTGDVFSKLLLLDADSLLITYGLLRRHQFLFLKFAECFAYAFNKRNLLDDLLHLLADCRLYKSHSSGIVDLTFHILKNNGLEIQAMGCIMEYLWRTSKSHEFKELNLKILQLLASSNWYTYTEQLSDMFKTEGFKIPPEILSTIISSTNGSPELKLKATQLLQSYMQNGV